MTADAGAAALPGACNDDCSVAVCGVSRLPRQPTESSPAPPHGGPTHPRSSTTPRADSTDEVQADGSHGPVPADRAAPLQRGLLVRARPDRTPPVANALFNKGFTLGELGRSEQEIEVYGQVLARFADAPEPALRKAVAQALSARQETK